MKEGSPSHTHLLPGLASTSDGSESASTSKFSIILSPSDLVPILWLLKPHRPSSPLMAQFCVTQSFRRPFLTFHLPALLYCECKTQWPVYSVWLAGNWCGGADSNFPTPGQCYTIECCHPICIPDP